MPEFSCSGVQHMGTHLPCPREASALQSCSPADLVTGSHQAWLQATTRSLPWSPGPLPRPIPLRYDSFSGELGAASWEPVPGLAFLPLLSCLN